MQLYEKYIKRLLDIILSSMALILLSPVLLIVALLIKLKLGSPVIFKQQRPGKNEEIFNMYKFRSMTDEKDAIGNLLPDEKRLTDFGKTLRSTSLDELPSLWNILRGDMSIVGPRPLLVEYLPLYNEFQKQRHDKSPGLTGLAQVSGRNALTWDEKFKLDVEYIKNITFINDFSIIFNTVLTVFKQEDISSKTSVTMEPFIGNDEVNYD